MCIKKADFGLRLRLPSRADDPADKSAHWRGDSHHWVTKATVTRDGAPHRHSARVPALHAGAERAGASHRTRCRPSPRRGVMFRQSRFDPSAPQGSELSLPVEPPRPSQLGTKLLSARAAGQGGVNARKHKQQRTNHLSGAQRRARARARAAEAAGEGAPLPPPRQRKKRQRQDGEGAADAGAGQHVMAAPSDMTGGAGQVAPAAPSQVNRGVSKRRVQERLDDFKPLPGSKGSAVLKGQVKATAVGSTEEAVTAAAEELAKQRRASAEAQTVAEQRQAEQEALEKEEKQRRRKQKKKDKKKKRAQQQQQQEEEAAEAAGEAEGTTARQQKKPNAQFELVRRRAQASQQRAAAAAAAEEEEKEEEEEDDEEDDEEEDEEVLEGVEAAAAAATLSLGELQAQLAAATRARPTPQYLNDQQRQQRRQQQQQDVEGLPDWLVHGQRVEIPAHGQGQPQPQEGEEQGSGGSAAAGGAGMPTLEEAGLAPALARVASEQLGVARLWAAQAAAIPVILHHRGDVLISAPTGAAASVASFEAAVLAEIYLCDVCSRQEILRRNGCG
eukprot:COSAG01_NODE_4826_length_4712_cov_21.963148_6_plen_559_part_00